MATERIGRAVLELVTDSAKFFSDLDKVDKRATDLNKSFDTVAKGLKSFGSGATDFGKALTVGITTPITAAVGGLVALAVQSAKTGDDIAKAAREAGLSAQSYQELTFAVGQVAKVTDEELTKAFGKLTIQISDAAAGNKNAIASLKELGFTTQEIASGTITTEQAFEALAKRMVSARSEADAMAIAGDLVGDRIGPKLAGALRESGDEVEKLRGQFRDLGLGMSDEAIAASEKFNDQMDLLTRQLGALGRIVGAEVLPVLVDRLMPALIEKGVPALRSLVEWVGKAVTFFLELPAPVQLVAAGFTAMLAAAGPLLIVIGQMASGLSTLAGAFGSKGLITQLTPLVTNWLPTLAKLLLGLTSPIGLVVTAVTGLAFVWMKWGDDIIRVVTNVFNTIDDFFGGALSAIFADLKAILSDIGSTIGNVASIIQSLLIIAFYEARDAVLDLWQSLKDNLGAVLDAISISFTQITGIAQNQVVPAFKAVVSAVVAAIPGLQSTIAAIAWLRDHTPGWSKSTGDAAAVLKVMADNASGASKATDTAGQSAEKMGQKATVAAAAVQGKARATKDAEEAARKHAQELEKQSQALDKLGIVTEASVNKSLKEYAALEAHAIKAGADKNAVLAAMLPLYEQLRDKAALSGVSIDAVTAAMNRAKYGADALTASYQRLIPNIPVEPLSQLPGTLMEIDVQSSVGAHAADMLAQSYQHLGITSRAELIATAEESRKSYELIKNSGTATTEEIAAAFRKMQEDARAASGEVPSFWETNVVPRMQQAYQEITRSLADNLAEMLTGTKSFGEGFKAIWQSVKQSLLGIFSEILHGFIDGFLKSMFTSATSTANSTVGSMGSIFDGGFKGIIANIGGIMKGGFSSILSALSGMLTSWIGVAMLAIGGLVALFSSAFRGGEEGTQVNPARNAFLAQFGPAGTGEGSGFWNLGVQLENAVGAAQAEALHAALRQADTMSEFNAAVAAINAALGGGGGAPAPPAPSGGGVHDTSGMSVEAPEEVMGIEEQRRLGLLDMAHGAIGRATRPTLFFTRGNEDFAFSGEGKRFGEAGSPVGSNPTSRAPLPPVTINQNGVFLGPREMVREMVFETLLDIWRLNDSDGLTRTQAVLEIKP